VEKFNTTLRRRGFFLYISQSDHVTHRFTAYSTNIGTSYSNAFHNTRSVHRENFTEHCEKVSQEVWVDGCQVKNIGNDLSLVETIKRLWLNDRNREREEIIRNHGRTR